MSEGIEVKISDNLASPKSLNGHKTIEKNTPGKGFITESTRTDLGVLKEINKLVGEEGGRSLTFTYGNSSSKGSDTFKYRDNGMTAYAGIEYTSEKIDCVIDLSMYTDKFVEEIRTDTAEIGCVKEVIELGNENKLHFNVLMGGNLKFTGDIGGDKVQDFIHKGGNLPTYDLEQGEEYLTAGPEMTINLNYLPNGYLKITNSANMKMFLDGGKYLNFSTTVEGKLANFKIFIGKQLSYFDEGNNRVENNTSENIDSAYIYGLETPEVFNTNIGIKHFHFEKDDRGIYTTVYLKVNF